MHGTREDGFARARFEHSRRIERSVAEFQSLVVESVRGYGLVG